MIEIDGAQGEGGGQIVRTALALSLHTGQSFRLRRIRAGRHKPGLLRQHLAAVRAATEVGGAKVNGAALGSTEIEFFPRAIRSGDYECAVGTAGSTVLVLQTILPALVAASARSCLRFEGGTLNPHAPPYDFFERVYQPVIHRLGWNVRVHEHRPGFYPGGGGSFRAEIDPSPNVCALSLLERGEPMSKRATVYWANLPESIAERERRALQLALGWDDSCLRVEKCSEANGPGNLVLIEQSWTGIAEMTSGFGERGVSSERVVAQAVDQWRRYLVSGAVVGEALADQLLLPLALAGGGEFLMSSPTRHCLTQAAVIQQFLSRRITFFTESEHATRCVVGS